jgi:hypothetical protein
VLGEHGLDLDVLGARGVEREARAEVLADLLVVERALRGQRCRAASSALSAAGLPTRCNAAAT